MAELEGRQQLSDADCLVLIPAAELHLVQAGQERIVEKGPLSLSVSSLHSGSPIIAKVGATSWPLERTSPTLKSGEYAYVFAVKGGTAFYSVLINTGTPDTDHALFEEILVECTAFQLAGALNEEAIREAVDFVTNALLRDGDSPHSPSSPAYPSASAEAAVAQVQQVQQAVASGTVAPKVVELAAAEEAPASAAAGEASVIAAGTAKVQEAIALGAAWASQKIMEQSKRWQQQIEPAHPVQISPELKARIRMGRDIAKKGASVAGRVSQKAADISIRVAESIVRRVGPSAGFGRQLNAGGQSRADAAQEIAAASLVAAVEIYASMEEAARTVVKSSGQATADLVGHRYGADAGEVSLHAAEATTHAATAAMRLRTVGIRSIAKRIAQHTSVSFARAAAASARPSRPTQPPAPATAAAPSGPVSPFATAPASILPVEPAAAPAPAPAAAAAPSGPLSPFALAPPPENEPEGSAPVDKPK
ncbi:g2787 [Coccomyxa elongata]